MSLFLGVDAGGTKTALCLVAPSGQLVGTAEVGSGYYLAAGVPALTEVLREGVTAVCGSAGVTADRVTRAFVGLPGYGEVVADVPALDAAPHEALGHERYRCGNDMVCAWAGSLAGGDGLNVVAGTGTIGYGEWRGRSARTGGWGELLGDEGSGYWIGLRGLQAFARMSDGRAAPGPLLDLLREHLGLTRDLDLIEVVLSRWRQDRTRIAALSRVVGAAAEAGDTAAAEILDAAGRELAAHAEALRALLGVDDGADRVTVPVSSSGGVMRMTAVCASFAGQLAARGGFDLRPPRLSPVAGAALLAARESGTPLSPESVGRLADESGPTR